MEDIQMNISSLQQETSNEMNNPILSCSDDFRQRQINVFAALGDLEVAHRRVTEDLKEEREVIQKSTWRHTIVAPEHIAKSSSKTSSNSIPIKNADSTRELEGNDTFRRPLPPPRQQPQSRSKCTGLRQPRSKFTRDSAKWTHYSLEDVDEDAVTVPNLSSSFSDDSRGYRDPNSAIASAFLHELRARRQSEQNMMDEDDGGSACGGGGEYKQTHRILFRPVAKSKRPRLEEADEEEEENMMKKNSSLSFINDLHCDSESNIPSDHSSFSQTEVQQQSPVFHNRRRLRTQQRRQINDQDDDEEEEEQKLKEENDDKVSHRVTFSEIDEQQDLNDVNEVEVSDLEDDLINDHLA